MPLKTVGEWTTADLGFRRLTLHFPGLGAERARALLAAARVVVPPPHRVWIPAASGRLVGEMKLGSAVRESSLRREAPSYLTACGLAMRRFVQ